jgi:putative ABC transport system permease protein
MKFWDLIKTANRNLWRNKVRTVLTIIAIFVGVFTITLTTALNAGVSDYVDRQLGSIGGDKIVLVSKLVDVEATSGPQKYNPDGGQSSATSMSDMLMNETDRAKIAEVEGVKKVQEITSADITYVQFGDHDKYLLSAAGQIDGYTTDLLAGAELDDNNENQILLPVGYVEALGFSSNEEAIGQTLKIAATNVITKQIELFDAKIVGVLNESIVSMGAGSNGATINDHLMQQITDYVNEGVPPAMLGGSMAFIASLDDNATAEQVRDRINALGSYHADTVSDMIGQVKTIIDAVTVVVLAFSAIALLAASFGIINTLYMSVTERTREIGLMKAMGMSSSQVFGLFSTEAILIGFWGSIVANIIAFAIGQGINLLASATFLADLTGFTLLIFTPFNTVAVMLVIMLIAFLAGTLPAKKAAKQNPIDALRYE